MSTAQSRKYECLEAAPDWITATAVKGGPSLAFEVIAEREFANEKAAGRDVTSGSRMGYRGFAASGLYFGRRHEDCLLIASGPRCAPLAQEITNAATNVSRLDLQITLATPLDCPHLALNGFNYLKKQRKQNHRPGHLTLIYGYPDGESLYLNKRSSDAYGRCYDKATESKLGPPRSIWRYEVEFKRKLAYQRALALSGSESPSSFCYTQVSRWWSMKGLELPAMTGPRGNYQQLVTPDHMTNMLVWFEDCLSITVGRSIKKHGLVQTIRALGLSKLVQPIADSNKELDHATKTFPPNPETEFR